MTMPCKQFDNTAGIPRTPEGKDKSRQTSPRKSEHSTASSADNRVLWRDLYNLRLPRQLADEIGKHQPEGDDRAEEELT